MWSARSGHEPAYCVDRADRRLPDDRVLLDVVGIPGLTEHHVGEDGPEDSAWRDEEPGSGSLDVSMH